MLDLDYKQTYQLMRKFRELGKIEVLIMDYLMSTDVAEVTYSELGKIIGKDASNTRKAVQRLENRGIVHVVYKSYDDENDCGCGAMVACFIVDGWMHILLGDL